MHVDWYGYVHLEIGENGVVSTSTLLLVKSFVWFKKSSESLNNIKDPFKDFSFNGEKEFITESTFWNFHSMN